MRSGLKPFGQAHAVGEKPQSPLGANSRVQQAHAAGSDVAGIGKERLALGLLRLIEHDQVGVGHVDFAADLQERRHLFARQAQGNILDGAHVMGDIVADAPVAPGNAAGQKPFFVD